MIFLDIETLPGDLERQDKDLKDIIKNGGGKCKLLKDEIVKELGDSNLKYKKVDELKPMWIERFPEKAAMEEYKNRSFDGGYGRVCSIALSKMGEEKIYSYSFNDTDSEMDLLTWFNDRLLDFCKTKGGDVIKDIFIGHNIPFDLKFLFRRFIVNKIKCALPLPFGGWHDKDFFCTSQAWCGRDGRISQDELCRVLGMEGKPGDIDGSKVYDFALEGRYEEIEAYNRDDVFKNKLIYSRLKLLELA